MTIASPAEARQLGIGMVFQHFSLFEALTVAENIALALPPRGRRELAETIRNVSREYGLPLDPDAGIADLSVGERQRVEIVRCLLQEPRLIIMDEPTSVLTPQEADLLFVTLRRLSSEGVAILYITHRLSEVLALAQPRHDPAARQAGRDCRSEGGKRQEPRAHDGRRPRWRRSSGRAAPPDAHRGRGSC